MSEGVTSEDVIDRDAVLRAAVEEHRRQLEALAAGMVRVEQIDQQLERLQAQRGDAVRELEQLHADLTSGRSAGEAIASLRFDGLSIGGQDAKPARRSAKRGAARVGNRNYPLEEMGDSEPASAAGPDLDAAATPSQVTG
jgi:hypothetical protein